MTSAGTRHVPSVMVGAFGVRAGVGLDEARRVFFGEALDAAALLFPGSGAAAMAAPTAQPPSPNTTEQATAMQPTAGAGTPAGRGGRGGGGGYITVLVNGGTVIVAGYQLNSLIRLRTLVSAGATLVGCRDVPRRRDGVVLRADVDQAAALRWDVEGFDALARVPDLDRFGDAELGDCADPCRRCGVAVDAVDGLSRAAPFEAAATCASGGGVGLRERLGFDGDDDEPPVCGRLDFSAAAFVEHAERGDANLGEVRAEHFGGLPPGEPLGLRCGWRGDGGWAPDSLFVWPPHPVMTATARRAVIAAILM